MKRRFFVFCIAMILGLSPLGYSQTVSAGSGGDFTTLAAAIDSFRLGGSNASNPDPNVINCLDDSYDELFPLIDVQLTINGKSGRSTLLGQNTTGGDALDFDVPAGEEVILNDLIIIPSAVAVPTDDLIGLPRRNRQQDYLQ